jgi:hypothetical protein
MVKILTILAVYLFCASALRAVESPRIEAKAQRSESTVGEQVEFIVVAQPAEKLSVNLPEKKKYFDKDIINPLDQKKVSAKGKDPETQELPRYLVEDLSMKEDGGRKEAHIIVRYFSPGIYQMPKVECKTEDGIHVAYHVPSVTVKPVNEKGETIDIEAPLALSGNYTRVIIMAGAALAIGALSAFLVVWFRKRKRVVELQPSTPAIEIFRSEMESLGKAIRSSEIDANGYAMSISESFKKLISARFNFDAMEMTSQEMIDRIGEIRGGMTRERFTDDLSRITMLWDITKFAEFTPSGEMIELNFNDTVKLAEKIWRESSGF